MRETGGTFGYEKIAETTHSEPALVYRGQGPLHGSIIGRKFLTAGVNSTYYPMPSWHAKGQIRISSRHIDTKITGRMLR